MRIRLLRSASKDIVDAYRFYEQQESGLGAYFVNCVYADLDLLVENAGIHPKVLDRFHRALVRKFPFSIFYCIDRDLVLIYGVIDCRRDPEYIRRKLLG